MMKWPVVFSRKKLESVVFIEEDFLHWEIQKKGVFRDLTTITNMTKLIERKVGNMKQEGGLGKFIR